MNLKIPFFSVFSLAILCGFSSSPTNTQTALPFPVPKQVIESDNTLLPNDSILSLLDNVDLSTPDSPPAVDTQSDATVQDPFSMPIQVQQGITAYDKEMKVQQEEAVRKQQILHDTQLAMQKEQAEKEQLTREKMIQEQQKAQALTFTQAQTQIASSSATQSLPVGVGSVMPIVQEMSQRYSVPMEWILGVIEHESHFNPQALGTNTNGTVDRGLMQLNSSTAPLLSQRIGVNYYTGIEYDPRLNIQMGTVYLAYLMQKSTDPHFVFTSYNRGEGGSQKLYALQGNYQSSYSISVMQNVNKYKALLYGTK